jgi:hypothetical protein
MRSTNLLWPPAPIRGLSPGISTLWLAMHESLATRPQEPLPKRSGQQRWYVACERWFVSAATIRHGLRSPASYPQRSKSQNPYWQARDITVRQQIPAELPMVVVDAVQIKHVLISILRNFIEAISSAANPEARSPSRPRHDYLLGPESDAGTEPSLPFACQGLRASSSKGCWQRLRTRSRRS